jgi:hypothetical protein
MALLQKGYLGATPLWRDIAWYEDGSPRILTRTGNVTLTANSSANTKGAYAQAIASTTANASMLGILVVGVATSATNTATLLDIATGASGSETVIIENIAVGASTSTYFEVPFKIASGTRISARIQSVVTGGKTAVINVFLIDAGDYANAPTSVDTIGSSTANSQGTSFSGASGTWVQAIASTSRAYRAVTLIPSSHDSDIGNFFNTPIEVGVGASGSEVAFGDLLHAYVSTEQSRSETPSYSRFGRNIPSGSRLAVRHSLTANPSRYGFTLIGIP